MDFTGQTALVTGASRGIGAATAEHLAALGMDVTLAARSLDACEAVAARIRGAGGTARAVACDVADHAQVAAAVEAARQGGHLDLLVNNAGLIDPIARLIGSDPAAWGAVIDVNVKGVYHGLHAALPHMRAGATVVNISSGAATSALDGWSHYCASKAAVLMLTRCAHKEYGPDIRVVGLSPGTVATEMQRQIKASGINPVSQLDWEAHVPPDWPARAIAWLHAEGAALHAGTDFSIKTEEGRRAVGLG